MKFLVIFVSLAIAANAAPQVQPFQYRQIKYTAPGQYQPDNSGAYNINEGQYQPDNSGAYVADGSGGYAQSGVAYKPYRAAAATAYKVVPTTYTDNSGQYVADNSGAYNNNDGQYHPDNSGAYKSDGSGAYNNNDGQYHPDNSGAYNPDGSGAYKHSDDPYKNQGGASNGGVGVYGTNVNKPTLVPVRPAVVVPVKDTVGYREHGNYAIIRKIEQVLEDGYHYIYETENGILAEEEGHLENKGQENEYMNVKGFYKYVGPDNVEYKVEYTVDDVNGFVPRGAHIPQATSA